LVRADADRALAVAHLDVEAELAAVDDLAERRAHRQRRALRRAADVLDAHLEADRRRRVGQVLLDEARARPLHDPDHPRRREHLGRQRPADVGQQVALGDELLLARRAHHIDSPPLTLIVWPVTYEASSEARNAMTAATSSGSPIRRSVVASIIACLSRAPSSPSCSGAELRSGVSIGPGATALARTPKRADSRAIAFVKPMTPAFAAAYVAEPCEPTRPASLATFTIT